MSRAVQRVGGAFDEAVGGAEPDQLQRAVDVTGLERLTAGRAAPAGWEAVDVDELADHHSDGRRVRRGSRVR